MIAARRDFHNEVRERLKRLPAARPAPEYRQILLAYDGSPGARAALERVAAVASNNTIVTVITVISFEAVGASPDPIKPELREWQWNSLIEATALLEQRGIRTFIEAAAGNPGHVIIEVARTLGADLVVLGRGPIRGWHPSIKRRSIPRDLPRSLDCDTLVVAQLNQDARPARPPGCRDAAGGN
jgi:nucleotide-binding universal stress UspA family protein